jgi:capsular polysaccharide biosynthesis protein
LDAEGRALKDANLDEELPAIGLDEQTAPIEMREGTTIFIGTLHPVFGHAITDNLKRLWFLQTAEGQKLLRDGARVIYLRYRGLSLPAYVFQVMALAGLDPSKFEVVEQPVRFRQLLIPDNALVLRGERRHFTEAFQRTIEAIRASVPAVETLGADQVYLSRTALRSGRDYGEAAIEESFRRKGFAIVHPERLSLEEQIGILSRCRTVAATEGSIAHGVIFCRPGTRFVLLKKANYVNSYQTVIEQMRNLHVTIVEAHQTIEAKQPWVGPFYLASTPSLRAFLGDDRTRRNRWLDREWYRYLSHLVRQQGAGKLRSAKRLIRKFILR